MLKQWNGYWCHSSSHGNLVKLYLQVKFPFFIREVSHKTLPEIVQFCKAFWLHEVPQLARNYTKLDFSFPFILLSDYDFIFLHFLTFFRFYIRNALCNAFLLGPVHTFYSFISFCILDIKWKSNCSLEIVRDKIQKKSYENGRKVHKYREYASFTSLLYCHIFYLIHMSYHI